MDEQELTYALNQIREQNRTSWLLSACIGVIGFALGGFGSLAILGPTVIAVLFWSVVAGLLLACVAHTISRAAWEFCRWSQGRENQRLQGLSQHP